MKKILPRLAAFGGLPLLLRSWGGARGNTLTEPYFRGLPLFFFTADGLTLLISGREMLCEDSTSNVDRLKLNPALDSILKLSFERVIVSGGALSTRDSAFLLLRILYVWRKKKEKESDTKIAEEKSKTALPSWYEATEQWKYAVFFPNLRGSVSGAGNLHSWWLSRICFFYSKQHTMKKWDSVFHRGLCNQSFHHDPMMLIIRTKSGRESEIVNQPESWRKLLK